MEGKWQVRVSGPTITGKSGTKTLYSGPGEVAGLAVAARFLRISVGAFSAAGDGPSFSPSAIASAHAPDWPVSMRPGGAAGTWGGPSPPGASCVRLSVAGQPVRAISAGYGGGSRGAYSGSVGVSAELAALATPTDEQARVIDLVVRQRKSIFLTGSAGTGKSFVLKHIQKGLVDLLPSGSLHLTAPTGIAAINIGGSTIHAFSGIGLGKGPHDVIISKCRNSEKTVARWREAQCLIIDEISMVSSDMFELLCEVGD
jgi:hypothetical protein